MHDLVVPSTGFRERRRSDEILQLVAGWKRARSFLLISCGDVEAFGSMCPTERHRLRPLRGSVEATQRAVRVMLLGGPSCS